ncbi:hypothetical protein [Shivajiella indica]|uniref:O-antigen ligase family protein n=1 Tax=Shivajiella indica TaxID=872115 RepID=A0ABW5BAZ4_9BACT
MSERVKGILLFVLVLVALRFFEIRFAGDLIGIKIPIVILTLISIYSLKSFFKYQGGFSLPIRLMTFATFFSIIISLLVWGQSIPQSFRSTAIILIYPVFFLLKDYNFKTRLIEQVILLLGFIYVVLYFFQFQFPQKAFFGYALGATEGDYSDEGRGIIRIIFPGAGVFWLAVFISICKITSKVKTAYYHIVFAILGIVIPILQVIRQLVAFIVVLYTFHFGVQLSLAKKLLFIAAFFGVSIYVISLDLPFINSLEETTRRDTELGSDYIRVVAGKYFLFDFSDNILSQIFGNGFPNYNSNYGKAMSKLTGQGYFLEDIGIIGLYTQAGVFAVLAWLIIFYKSFTIPIPKEYMYCKYYIWMILVTSLTSGSIFNIHFTISSVLVLYIYHIESQNIGKDKLKKLLVYLQKKNISLEEIKKESPATSI